MKPSSKGWHLCRNLDEMTRNQVSLRRKTRAKALVYSERNPGSSEEPTSKKHVFMQGFAGHTVGFMLYARSDEKPLKGFGSGSDMR
jgi:hypothetical protein